MRNILENIKAMRDERGFTQEYMAVQLNVSQPAYLNWEKGKRELTYNILVSISHIFQCRVIDIITYPDKYSLVQYNTQQQDEPLEAILQIRLKKEKRNQVLSLVFGENNLEILNK